MRKSMKKSRDRISELPDDVVASILCLLPKKYAMRTSILSKRWTNLWKSTCLHATNFNFGKEFAQAQTQEQFAASVNKCLHLHIITDAALERLISNCPALTNLCLKSCSGLRYMKVSSLSLKCLSFIVPDAHEIEIFAPNLKSLYFYGDLLFNYDAYYFLNVDALEDFFISANGYECTEEEHDFIKIISGVSHVKILTVCLGAPVFTTLAERCNLGPLPIALPNLEELQILIGGQIREEYLDCLFNFFNHIVCPSLDKIFIDLSGSHTPPLQNVEPAEVHLSCVFSNLKTVKINQFRGTGPEIEMVKFFLQRACTLELMVLVAASESPPVEDTSIVRDGGRTLHSENSMKPFLKELVALPKSSNVQMLLFDHGEVDTSLSPVHRHTDYYVDDILGPVDSVTP
ncbi:hypothetical protein ACHQM5_000566 [Ranunculus cassubicifolius]